MERMGRRLAAVVTALTLGPAAGLAPAGPAQACADDTCGPTARVASVPRGFEQTSPAMPHEVFVELSEPVAVDWTVLVTTIDGTAVAPGDYQPIAERVTVPAGELSVVVSIELFADRLVEPPEWFVVEISGPSSGQIGTGRVEITIEDNPPSRT